MNDDRKRDSENPTDQMPAPDKEVAPLQSAMEKLSKNNPRGVMEMFSMMGVGPMANPLHSKMTESHITQVLDLATKHDEREYDLNKNEQEYDAAESKSARRYIFATFLVIVALIVIILALFRNNPNVLVPILTGAGGLIAGSVGGYGYGRSRSDG